MLRRMRTLCRFTGFDSQIFQHRFRSFQFRKEFFLLLKGFGVNASPAAVQPYWVLQVQHFVVHDVLNCVARHVRAIEDSADNDGVVCGIIMAEILTRGMTTPCHQRARKQPVKETPIKFFKNLIQVIVTPLGTQQHLSPTLLANEVSLPRNIFSSQIAAIARRMPSLNLPKIELCQQDMGDRVQNVLGSSRQ